MKTETECEIELVASLSALGVAAHYQDSAYKKNKALKSALKGASKSAGKSGTGKPDGVIFSDASCDKPIALIEVKGEGDFFQARMEAQGYVRAVATAKCFVPLAIGYDGAQLSVDFYDETTNTFTPCLLANGLAFMDRFSQSRCWPTESELLAASRSSDGQLRENISVLEEDFTRDFILQINDTMQVASVPVIDRVVIFTAFLVACRSDVFRSAIKTETITANRIGRQTLAGFEALVEEVDDEEVRAGLEGFTAFIKPKLIAPGKGEESNAAVAIYRIVKDDIPALCAKHKKDVDDLINALNSSMFNLVDVYEAFQAYAPENDLGQYFTPRHVVRAMIRLVEQFRGRKLNETDIVYDPACGVGGFLVGALERVAESKHGKERVLVKQAFGSRLLGCEPAAEIIQVARINLWMHGDGTSGIFKDSSLERDHLPGKGKGTKPGDNGLDKATPATHPIHKAMAALQAKGISDQKPTVVLMNPPFPTKKKSYHAFEFVEHALSHLREGGWLCAVVPATTIVSEDKAHVAFRKRLLQHSQLAAVIGMPADLFAPGASVNTYLLLLQKQATGHQANRSVLFARCPDDGYAMDKSTQRRVAPKSEAGKALRRWTKDGDFGGHLADLLAYNKLTQTQGDWWVKLHKEGGVDVHRHALSANLPKDTIENGSEWSPEKFINDQVDSSELLRLANRIYAEAQAYELVKTAGGIW